jgi:hypothetical protein
MKVFANFVLVAFENIDRYCKLVEVSNSEESFSMNYFFYFVIDIVQDGKSDLASYCITNPAKRSKTASRHLIYTSSVILASSCTTHAVNI